MFPGRIKSPPPSVERVVYSLVLTTFRNSFVLIRRSYRSWGRTLKREMWLRQLKMKRRVRIWLLEETETVAEGNMQEKNLWSMLSERAEE